MSPGTVNGSKPIVYHSTYEHGVDDKRRIQIPAKWRPDEGDGDLTIIAWQDQPSQRTCLRVLPRFQFDAMLARIASTSTSNPETVALRRKIARDSDQVAMDKAGRICLPEFMAKRAEISKEVVLVGALQWFEIWNPTHYEVSRIADDALSPEALKVI